MNYYPGRSGNPVMDWFNRSAVNKIVAANVVIFIMQLFLQRTAFQYYLALRPYLLLRGFLWQAVTYMFLHGDIWHIGLNMFVIWMFGRQLEHVWGSSRFVKYYFVCGLGGAVFSFIFSYTNPVIGASAAAYGLLLAYAVLFPHNQIFLWGLFPVRARTLVIALIVIELFSGMTRNDNIAHFAHLGGIVAGLIYIRSDHRAGGFLSKIKKFFSSLPVKIDFSDSDSDQGRKQEKEEEPLDYSQGKVDSILDKISEKGYESLTETERRILEKYSENEDKT
ncbi:MAG: rhomboid family intramembrane serine protease [Candidatus Latescibacteria bacterium]|nr:rhomboid family intramembrane serine protease [bacterium]MBD3423365.1 rhomboid family intramembrane serine protease [Candidatus Latescibacterota bacterium]